MKTTTSHRRLLRICIASAVLFSAGNSLAELSLVTSRAAIQASDSIDWAVLGPPTSDVGQNNGGVVTVVVPSVGGQLYTVQKQTDGLFRRLNNRPPVEGGWSGNFAPGDALLTHPNSAGPVAILVPEGRPVAAIGMQIQPNGDNTGTFVAQIEAFGEGGVILGVFQVNGVRSQTADNSAVFIGVRSDQANILAVRISTNSAFFGGDFAINRVSIAAPRGEGNCVLMLNGAEAAYPAEGDAVDVVGSNNGVPKNGATFAPGKVGQAFSLDGADDYVEIPSSSTLNPGVITLEAWINPKSINQGSRIISKDSSATSCAPPTTVAYSLEARGLQGNRADFYFTTSGNVFHELVGTSVIPIGVFTHVAATYDGSTAKLYVNGVLESSLAAVGPLKQTSDAPVVIGSGGPACRDFAGGRIEFHGLIDEVGVYNRALSAGDIRAIVDAGSSGKCQQIPILKTAEFGGHTYHLLAGPMSWAASEAAAARMGGHLATISSAEENAFVLNTFASTASAGGGKVSLWIGLNDREKEGAFVWSSGEIVSYTNWSAGQPQGTAADEDVVGIFTNFGDVGRWHDLVSDGRLGDVTYGVVEIGPRELWTAGLDLLANEKPNNAAESNARNTAVPEWSYGYRTRAAGTALTPFPPASHQNSNGDEGWNADGNQLRVNTSSTPIIYNTGFGNYRPFHPQQLRMHPSAANDFVVARWTAPANGNYRIFAKWLDLDNHGGNGASGHVVINGTEVFGRKVPADSVGPARFVGQEWNDGGNAAMPAEDFKLVAGDVVDFALGSRGDFTFDNTTFNAFIRRVPGVEITNAPPESITLEGADVTLTADVNSDRPIKGVTLLMDGQTVAHDTTAPYSLTQPNVGAGVYYFTVAASDNLGVGSVSQPIKLTVLRVPPTAAARTGSKGTSGTIAAFSTGGRTYFCTQSGSWENPATWGGEGIPGRNDDAVIPKGFAVNAQQVEVQNLDAAGSLVIGSPQFPRRFAVYGTLQSSGEIQGGDVESQLVVFNRFSCVAGQTSLRDLTLIVSGETVVTGRGGISSSNCSASINGSTSLFSPPGTNRPVVVKLGTVDLAGALRLDVHAQFVTNSLIGNDGASILTRDGAGLITDNGAGLIGNDGASIIGRDGAGIIGRDGAGLIGLDGATLIGLDGATLIGLDGATLIGNDGATLIGNDGSTLLGPEGAGAAAQERSVVPTSGSGSPPPELRAATADFKGIALERGTITGSLNLIGNVLNRAGFISPGSSAGKIRVKGNYTQEAGGTLLLEVGGTQTVPLQFDQLQISGTATLGGALIVKTIDGFTPQAGDQFAPLTFGAVTGAFAKITSNAQVSFGANGMVMQVSGPNPPAPKALNISTRMRVETGDNVLIAGFIITGSAPKKVLVRGIGPSLPVSGALADPVLELDNGAIINDDWKSGQEQAIRDTTIPPTSDLEAAIVTTLQPGPHTAILRGKSNGTGVGLVEVYDLETGSPVQLANISTRGQVQTGDDVMIGGFIIAGDYPAKVLLRAIGPSLAEQGVSGALQDPTLELVDGQGNTISNDNWRATQEAEIAAILPPNADAESAIIATLVPGAYTAIVRGKDGTVGVALVEGYNLQ